jgi:UDP-glucose 4-epimerase
VPLDYGPRRAGDPPSLVADPTLARSALGWQAAHPDPRFMIAPPRRWLTGPQGGRYDRSADAA